MKKQTQFMINGYHVCSIGISRFENPEYNDYKHSNCQLPDEHEVSLCEKWIKEKAHKTKKIERHVSSYSYKHMVESDVKHYVSNGAFIKAAFNLGYKFEIIEDVETNCYFNISTHPVEIDLEQERLNKEIKKMFDIMMPDSQIQPNIDFRYRGTEVDEKVFDEEYNGIKLALQTLPKVIERIKFEFPKWILAEIHINNGGVELEYRFPLQAGALYEKFVHTHLLSFGYELESIIVIKHEVVVYIKGHGGFVTLIPNETIVDEAFSKMKDNFWDTKL